MHQPRPHVWLESQREVVDEHLLISPSGSLDSDGVNAQELCRVQSSIILFWYLWLEDASRWPTDLPELMSEGGAPNLERQVPVSTGHGLVNVRAIAPIGLSTGFAASFDGDARVFPPHVLEDLPLVSMGSRIR